MALTDQYALSQDATFQGRVQQATVTAAVQISSEADAVAFHPARVRLATKVLQDPVSWTKVFAAGVASDTTIAGHPTNPQVLDSEIQNAVSGQWNGFAGARQMA